MRNRRPKPVSVSCIKILSSMPEKWSQFALVWPGNDLWIDAFEQKACSSWMNVVVVFPEQVKPTPGFSLVHGDSLTKLLESVRKGKGVEATFEGRFDAAFVWRDHKRIPVGTDPGYWKKNRYDARIVLHRVSDVLVLPGSRL